MNNQFLIEVCLFHVKHHVRLLFPCLPKCFGTFSLAEQYLHSFQDFEPMRMSVLRVVVYLICVWLCLCSLTIKTRSELEKMTARKREFPSVLPGLGKFCDWHWEKHSYWASIMCCSIVLHCTTSSNPTVDFNFLKSVCLLAAVLDYRFWKGSLSGLFCFIFLSYIVSQRNH